MRIAVLLILFLFSGGAFAEDSSFKPSWPNDDKWISDYTKKIELNPNDSRSYRARGQSYEHKGEHDQAIADYTKAIESNPTNFKYFELAEAYCERGDIYYGKGDKDKTVADYAQAIALLPVCQGTAGAEETFAKFGIAGLKALYGISCCTDRLAEGDSGSTNNIRHFNNRAGYYSQLGNQDMSIADYTKVIELAPGDINTYDSRADIYMKKGDYDRAIADYTKAIALYPQDEIAYGGRSRAYQARYDKSGNQKDQDQAKADADAAKDLLLNPVLPESMYVPGELIIMFDNIITKEDIEIALSKYEVKIIGNLNNIVKIECPKGKEHDIMQEINRDKPAHMNSISYNLILTTDR